MPVSSSKGGIEDEGCYEVTQMLAFGPTSDVLPRMPGVLISSEMDFIIGTSDRVVIVVVVGKVDFVKMGVENGIEIWG